MPLGRVRRDRHGRAGVPDRGNAPKRFGAPYAP